MTKTISVLAAGEGSFSLYLAEPDETPRAAIIVGQEIYGVNADIRRKCDLLARQGYLAVAPDLFWRLEPGVELDPYASYTKDRSLALARRFDSDAGIRDVQATIDRTRLLAGGTVKVGLIGYSLGGRLAAFAAARTDIDAAVGYYGVRVPMMLAEVDHITCPLMLHIAKRDEYVDPSVQEQMHRGLDHHPLVTIHDYPGQQHDFAYEFGDLRSAEAASLADTRTMAFLQKALAKAC